MLRLASELAFKVRFLNNNFQPACCTWSRPYFCSFKNWILKYGKYSECEAALSKALITELLKEHHTIDAVANFDSLCHGLHDWLDLSLNHTVPSSLLILCRAFYASGEASPEKAVQATLSFLPDKIVDTVGVTTLPSEDSVLGSRRKLEFLEMQEEPIKVFDMTL
ncbi:hypothetical protein AB3S75_006651 [Citrus x aurantiifolia]